MSTIKVDTIATRTGSGNITASNIIAGTSATLSGTLGVTGHAAIGASIVDSSRALSIAGATDGSSGTILNCFNSSLASKFSVRDDGYITTTNNIGIASGKGIDFSGNANAAGMTSELLDDYEEGTWTATLGGMSSNPTVSAYAYNSGHYTKIGRQVFAQIYMRIESGNISGGSGDATILGLPFASKSTGSISNGAGAWIENYTYTANSFSSGRSYARPFMVAGENRMRINQLSFSNPTQSTGWGLTQVDDGYFLLGGVMVYMTG